MPLPADTGFVSEGEPTSSMLLFSAPVALWAKAGGMAARKTAGHRPWRRVLDIEAHRTRTSALPRGYGALLDLNDRSFADGSDDSDGIAGVADEVPGENVPT